VKNDVWNRCGSQWNKAAAKQSSAKKKNGKRERLEAFNQEVEQALVKPSKGEEVQLQRPEAKRMFEKETKNKKRRLTKADVDLISELDGTKPVKEIAEQLGCCVNTVYNHLNRREGNPSNLLHLVAQGVGVN